MSLFPFAEPVIPRFRRRDLVLPAPQARRFDEILSMTDQRLPVLFAGPSGKGRTMAAEVIAAELALPLYRVDLPRVVSKYIGETEKNLQMVFDSANSGGAILLFDEADALFGKRTGVKDSHDKYANLLVDYLLERIQRFNGLAILSTNRKSSINAAVRRRLRFIVDFPE